MFGANAFFQLLGDAENTFVIQKNYQCRRRNTFVDRILIDFRKKFKDGVEQVGEFGGGIVQNFVVVDRLERALKFHDRKQVGSGLVGAARLGPLFKSLNQVWISIEVVETQQNFVQRFGGLAAEDEPLERSARPQQVVDARFDRQIQYAFEVVRVKTRLAPADFVHGVKEPAEIRTLVVETRVGQVQHTAFEQPPFHLGREKTGVERMHVFVGAQVPQILKLATGVDVFQKLSFSGLDLIFEHTNRMCREACD